MNTAQKLQDVARQYREEGYSVLVHPAGAAIPSFVNGLELDIIASKPGENVIVEVAENRDSFAKKPELLRLVDVINAQPGWRFDLVILEPESAVERALADSHEPTDKQLAEFLSRAEKMLGAQETESAVIYALAALEAIMRRVRGRADLNRTATPTELLTALYSNGFLSRPEYDTLRSGFRLRTHIVHGLEPLTVDANLVHYVIAVARKLIGTDLLAERPAAG
jgi:uncharacterized protein YutE (UPF0331/DUF86 family)